MLIMFILNLILIKKNIIKGGKIYIYIGKEETVILPLGSLTLALYFAAL